jgi:hypothetical protein
MTTNLALFPQPADGRNEFGRGSSSPRGESAPAGLAEGLARARRVGKSSCFGETWRVRRGDQAPARRTAIASWLASSLSLHLSATRGEVIMLDKLDEDFRNTSNDLS